MKLEIKNLLTEEELLKKIFNILRKNGVEIIDVGEYIHIMKNGKNIGSIKHTNFKEE